ncbi:FGGY-family carbohydrate kinase [Cryptosporangium aurantiacum]|uniref:Sugar (Pentulose or hexulose) kinase n=1 Tax=Cryptosporangium aurantiacum TaxID=134849 RepID=A0A1M7RBN8_9ACTN|nr:FGGY family carbohydrate kinase [Cryptosporangium aurantiacum]SHN43621.1 Sugar (pentulose or hexulose) kinase [Cryptosporangium aurantiacum]
MRLLLGVDVGTSDTKVLVLRADGTRVGVWRRPTVWRDVPSGHVETPARTLLDGVLGVVGDALAACGDGGRAGEVAAMGLTGLAESGVVVDAAGQPRGPVIAWHDPRGAEQLARVPDDVRSAFGVTTGLPFHQQWTLAKLLWAADHGLELRPGDRWLNVPEYVAFALGADPVAEPSLASRTGLLDQDSGEPWTAALDLLGVGPRFVPERRYAGEPAGVVRSDEAPAGLRGATLSVAGHDHPVAAFGAGAVGSDDLFNSCGTADTLLRAIPRVVTPDERRILTGTRAEVGRHILPGTTLVNAPSRAGLVLRRVLGALGASEPDAAWAHGNASRAVVTGADIRAEDVVIGLHEGATPADVWAAALAHTAGHTAELLARITPVAGPYRRAVAAGGWLRLAGIRESKSAVLPGLCFSALDQPGAFGAAVLAAWAAADHPGTVADFAAALRA